MGRGISHPCSAGKAEAERAKRSGGLHKRSAEDWGDPLRRAIGAEPLSRLVYLAGRGAQELSGRALREGTARRGGWRRTEGPQTGSKLPPILGKKPLHLKWISSRLEMG